MGVVVKIVLSVASLIAPDTMKSISLFVFENEN